MKTLINTQVLANGQKAEYDLIGYINFIMYNSEGIHLTEWTLSKTDLSSDRNRTAVYETLDAAKKQAKKLQYKFKESIQQREYYLTKFVN